MSQPLDNLQGFSQALFSTWFYYLPDRTLFDCGEGMVSALKTKVFGIERVLLSHTHLDHISGLPQLLFSRSASRGDKTKPLTVHYPAGDPDFQHWIDHLGRILPDLPYPLVWEPLEVGQEVMMGSGRIVRAFPVEHDSTRPCYGFQLVGTKRRLKDEYKGRPGAELAAAGDEKFEVVECLEFAYSGDTVPGSPDPFRRAWLMAHECTFLDPADSKRPTHSDLLSVLDIAKEASPKALLLYHVSSRYSAAMAGRAVYEEARKRDLPFPVYVQYGRYAWDAYTPGEDRPSGRLEGEGGLENP